MRRHQFYRSTTTLSAKLCRVKRSFTQYQNEHDSVKEAREKGKQPFNVDLKIAVKILFNCACPPIFPFTLKAVPNAQQKKDSEERKAKEEGRRESEKEKKYCWITNKKLGFLGMPELWKLPFCIWIKRPRSVQPVDGFVYVLVLNSQRVTRKSFD